MPGKDRLKNLVDRTRQVLASGTAGTPAPPAATPEDAEQAAEDAEDQA